MQSQVNLLRVSNKDFQEVMAKQNFVVLSPEATANMTLILPRSMGKSTTEPNNLEGVLELSPVLTKALQDGYGVLTTLPGNNDYWVMTIQDNIISHWRTGIKLLSQIAYNARIHNPDLKDSVDVEILKVTSNVPLTPDVYVLDKKYLDPLFKPTAESKFFDNKQVEGGIVLPEFFVTILNQGKGLMTNLDIGGERWMAVATKPTSKGTFPGIILASKEDVNAAMSECIKSMHLGNDIDVIKMLEREEGKKKIVNSSLSGSSPLDRQFFDHELKLYVRMTEVEFNERKVVVITVTNTTPQCEERLLQLNAMVDKDAPRLVTVSYPGDNYTVEGVWLNESLQIANLNYHFQASEVENKVLKDGKQRNITLLNGEIFIDDVEVQTPYYISNIRLNDRGEVQYLVMLLEVHQREAEAVSERRIKLRADDLVEVPEMIEVLDMSKPKDIPWNFVSLDPLGNELPQGSDEFIGIVKAFPEIYNTVPRITTSNIIDTCMVSPIDEERVRPKVQWFDKALGNRKVIDTNGFIYTTLHDLARWFYGLELAKAVYQGNHDLDAIRKGYLDEMAKANDMDYTNEDLLVELMKRRHLVKLSPVGSLWNIIESTDSYLNYIETSLSLGQVFVHSPLVYNATRGKIGMEVKERPVQIPVGVEVRTARNFSADALRDYLFEAGIYVPSNVDLNNPDEVVSVFSALTTNIGSFMESEHSDWSMGVFRPNSMGFNIYPKRRTQVAKAFNTKLLTWGDLHEMKTSWNKLPVDQQVANHVKLMENLFGAEFQDVPQTRLDIADCYNAIYKDFKDYGKSEPCLIKGDTGWFVAA